MPTCTYTLFRVQRRAYGVGAAAAGDGGEGGARNVGKNSGHMNYVCWRDLRGR